MLTILFFLFSQDIAFGVAACALIPLQSWLIPKLQHQVNLLNRKRVLQVGALAGEIGESATGAETLRVHGGWRYRMAGVSDRLGKLFYIRLEVFKKKFFMKFVNNFITQLTPFFFYTIGGYLAIKGDISLGALVAALAAYKDLSAPWKSLLQYYNQHQDMSLRWAMITEKFTPPNAMDPALFDDPPTDILSLSGPVELRDVSVQDADGKAVLNRISAEFPAASCAAISAPREEDRRALGDVLVREVIPSSGSITLSGHALAKLHQAIVALRIGHASSTPVVFAGTYGENTLMPFRSFPVDQTPENSTPLESVITGNGGDRVDARWGSAASRTGGRTTSLNSGWPC